MLNLMMYRGGPENWSRWHSMPFDSWGSPLFLIGMGFMAVWSLVWKGLALWKSARQESKVWFIVLLLVNTAGILDILYIYYFSRKPDNWLHRLARKIHQ